MAQLLADSGVGEGQDRDGHDVLDDGRRRRVDGPGRVGRPVFDAVVDGIDES